MVSVQLPQSPINKATVIAAAWDSFFNCWKILSDNHSGNWVLTREEYECVKGNFDISKEVLKINGQFNTRTNNTQA